LEPTKPLVINLAAGPGAGKSTTAAMLFGELKLMGKKVELVTEYAKDLTYEKAVGKLANQLYVLAKQYHRLCRVKDHVDYIVTDSPLFLTRFYGPPKLYSISQDLYDEFNNALFFIERVKPYAAYGRNQTEEEARDLDRRIRAYIGMRHDHDTTRYVVGNENAHRAIIFSLQERGLL
jgi:hypothetical protein